jgi:hypothetical protein
MEEKDQTIPHGMTFSLTALRSSTFWVGLFAVIYMAVLPMSETIALRNLALLLLLVCLAWQFQKIRHDIQWSLPLVLWAVYLTLFPLTASDHETAWRSFGGQWSRGLLAMLAGAGVAAVAHKKIKVTAFHLGLVSAFTICVHLVILGWKTLETSSIPWGYWGRETHHADLGYAAGQAIVLLAAAWVAGKKKYRPLATGVIVACLLSTAMANSRAGFVFGVIGGALVFGSAFLSQASQKRRQILWGFLVVVLAGAAIFSIAVKNDARWRNMWSQITAGFHGDALQIQCEGTASVEPWIISQYGPGEQAQRVINAVRDGDGARIVLLRAGFQLALKHPWGSDGSRQAYKKLLRQECPNPAISMAHAHDGWLDTILAIGWIGAALYLWVLLYLFSQGYAYLRREEILNEWALVLVSLSAFWILRGFTDSVYRDHMFEMQGFVLCYALMAMRNRPIAAIIEVRANR